MMSIEELRREVEEQESLVEDLRRAKAQREDLLKQLRELVQCAEPKLFAELNDDVRDILSVLTEKRQNDHSSNKDSTNSDDHINNSPELLLFSKEMEERIMQEEEPSFSDPPIFSTEHDSEGKGRRKKKKNKKKNRKKKENEKEKEMEIKKVQYVDPCRTVFSARELSAREALLAAVDAIQIECKTSLVENNGDKANEKIPIWLDGENVPPQKLDNNEKGNDNEDPYYSDDFE
ncbi:uncharacterized protein TM35_000182520 [Trypanosoma theileri]|uniref:Uncharacterized protein n=1 Tax=Trypanosoma theileri TaxID=67003 RepID=A0A1X0NU21_9TRYP|nr:uncharacterized protein TM35_000182520 [Trypanosoma theileri]ORC88195.1 hypothetical protein TM35_000182520 [Trypanosoma theileri]